MAQQATNTSLRSPLGRVRGLGSAKGGTHHWFMQRITSVALLPLTIWFALSIVFTLAGASYEEAALWVGRPFNAVLLLALIAASFHHIAAGMQVIVEDYANSEWAKLAAILTIKAICWLLAVASALAVLRVALQ
jgi:succinate dehydrogenase / fumarate reductase, membrane anchor subunit